VKASNFDVERAVNMFCEMGGSAAQTGGGGPSSAFATDAAGGSSLKRSLDSSLDDDDYVRPADPVKRQRLMDAEPSFGGYQSHGPPIEALGAVTNPFRDYGAEGRRHARNALQPGGARANREPTDPKLAQLFEPPHALMFQGSFQDARAKAKADSKFLFVNLQSEAEFDCHQLNRDTFKDEMFQDIVQASCIFWQQMNSSAESRVYATRYLVTGYPHLALIDPRTAREIWHHTGFVGPERLAEMLTDVCDRNPLDAPPSMERLSDPLLHSSRESEEERQLREAIAASMTDPKSAGTAGNDSDAEVQLVESTKEATVSKQAQSTVGLSIAVNEELGVEPEAGEESVTRLQMRMPDGGRKVRRFRKCDKVSALYRFARKQTGEDDEDKDFDIFTSFPVKSLLDQVDMTLEEANLCNAAVAMKWIDP
jgi:hypothetical protein